MIAVIATWCVAVWVSESRPSKNKKMDWQGVIWLVISVGSMLFGLSEAVKMLEASGVKILSMEIISVLAFILFWRTESSKGKRDANPLVETKHLKSRATWALLLTTTLTMTGVFATINGLVMSHAQNVDVGFGLNAADASLYLLTPYALIGWLVAPFTGRLAPQLGYGNVLRLGLIGSVCAIAIMLFGGLNSLLIMAAAVFLLGICYSGTANIMLNGMGIVLSPTDNPGFLPGLNAGAFNLGAGLSFALLPTIQFLTSNRGGNGYFASIAAGLILTMVAFFVSFLIPRPQHGEL